MCYIVTELRLQTVQQRASVYEQKEDLVILFDFGYYLLISISTPRLKHKIADKSRCTTEKEGKQEMTGMMRGI